MEPANHFDAGARAPRIPDDRRLYVVGDIHGRFDLLVELHALIRADAETGRNLQRVVVYLGDYVDRGPGSFDVIDLLINEPLPGFEAVHLMGNHEAMMLEFLTGPPEPIWTSNGGIATLASYGLDPPVALYHPADLETFRLRLREALPPDHLGFLQGLRFCHGEGDYFFVHAGVRPGVPLEAQDPDEMMWIRDRFLLSDADFGKRVVHGHTPSRMPEVCENRIGIDTGAFYSGCLTCLVLEGAELRFLHT
jgi:serine/threonine protein phosphatase 1